MRIALMALFRVKQHFQHYCCTRVTLVLLIDAGEHSVGHPQSSYAAVVPLLHEHECRQRDVQCVS